jgi:hypothetical protein
MGAALWMNAVAAGPWMVAAGFGVLLVMLFGWFGAVIGESEAHLYNKKVDASFRWSMSWFIFSEVMFFFAFFGTLFYIRQVSVPDLGSLMSKVVWPDYTSDWPTNGPYIDERFTPMGAIGIPLVNTIILLSSGFTLTVAHHALRAGHRTALKVWLFATIALAISAPDKETLIANEKGAWQTFKDKKADEFRKYLAADFRGVYAQGIYNVDRQMEDLRKMDLRSYDLSDFDVTFPDADTAIVTYKVSMQATMDGKDASGAFIVGSVWRKSKGAWHVIFHSDAAQPKAQTPPG